MFCKTHLKLVRDPRQAQGIPREIKLLENRPEHVRALVGFRV